MTRRQHLEQLLRRYPDTLGSFGAGTGRGNGDNTPAMPEVYWAPSVQELERCLDLMRTRFPRVRQHVWYRFVETHKVSMTVRLRDGKYIGLPERCEVIVGAYAAGRNPKTRRVLPQQVTPGAPTERVLVAMWPRWVRPQIVDVGVSWLEREYKGEPMLPVEMVKAA